MLNKTWVSSADLVSELKQRSDLTERELILIDRLQCALDEIDALVAELDRKTYGNGIDGTGGPE